MNERILELADQAAEGMAGLNIPDEFCKKFAELIIQESIKVMIQNDYHGDWLGEKIKEHFGVELCNKK